jgi:transposase InsO family protein
MRLQDRRSRHGPQTICWHLARHHGVRVSAATVSRHLTRAGLVTPEPAKRPRSSYLRFAAELPNECWQSDFTHWRLAGGADTEIIWWLDDHSRHVLHLTAHVRVTGPVVTGSFRSACAGAHPRADQPAVNDRDNTAPSARAASVLRREPAFSGVVKVDSVVAILTAPGSQTQLTRAKQSADLRFQGGAEGIRTPDPLDAKHDAVV